MKGAVAAAPVVFAAPATPAAPAVPCTESIPLEDLLGPDPEVPSFRSLDGSIEFSGFMFDFMHDGRPVESSVAQQFEVAATERGFRLSPDQPPGIVRRDVADLVLGFLTASTSGVEIGAATLQMEPVFRDSLVGSAQSAVGVQLKGEGDALELTLFETLTESDRFDAGPVDPSLANVDSTLAIELITSRNGFSQADFPAVDVGYSVVPEPTSAALLGIGLSALLFARRRQT